MKKTYKVVVDCANCANLMENEINKMAEVKNVIINFMTQKMIIEFDENVEVKDVLDKVIKICTDIDSDFEIE